MSKILVGGISEESNRLLNIYIDKFMPDVTVEPLRAAGIKGKIKNHAKRSEVIMVIIEDALYQLCVGVADEVLCLPKVHRYVDDDGLKQFLISKFGKLESDETSSTEDMVMKESFSSPSQTKTVEYVSVDDEDSSSLIVSQDKSDDLEKKLRVEISTRDAIIENLKNQIKELSEDDDDDYSAVYKRVSELEEKLKAKENEVAELTARSNSDSAKLSKAESAISEVAELKAQVAKGREDNSALEFEKSNLTKELEKVNGEVESLKSEIERLKTVESEANDLNDISEKYNTCLHELNSMTNQKNKLESDIVEKDDEIARLKADVADKGVLEDRCNKLTEKYESSTSKISELESKLTNVSSEALDAVKLELNTVKAEKSTLEIEKTDLENKVITLNEQLALNEKDSEGFIKRNEELESQITEYKRSVARLESEKSTLQSDLSKARDTSEKDKELANLRIEVTRLQSDLRARADETKANSEGSAKRVQELEAILTSTRERAAKLELDNHEKDEQLKELHDNVFLKMADYALPKITVPLSLPMPFESYSNIFTFASGSAESCVSAYQVIRQLVSSDSNKTYLIVDLVTDTYIDREIGVRNIKSPASWLQGSEPIDNFIADTRFDNVKVVSTALAYMNDLFLLMVDWKKRLEELKNKADVVILNVGSLDNIVHNTLFNSFSNITRCHVIVKATPINLRTAILHLLGFSQLKNTLISCVNIEEESQQLYQKLASKFPTQLLSSSDILSLEK